MMLVAAKWREFQSQNPASNESEAEQVISDFFTFS
jgi:hypothetical protein